MVESQTMRLPSEDSTTEPNKVRTLTEQEVIDQTQAELVGLMRSPQQAMENWQHSVRLGNWSGTLESEIYHSLW